jgi:acyl-CoA dehydrogenase
MMLEVLGRALQAYGAAGVFQDTPLAAMWANRRTTRIVDGPDEVHVLELEKNENKRGYALRQRIGMQKARAKGMLAS